MIQPDDSGTLAQAGIDRDVEALRASELQHRLISQLITAYSFAYEVGADRAVKLEWITPGVTDVIGYSEADLKGAVSFRSRIHPEDRAQQQAALDQTVAGNPVTMEFRFLTKSGEQRWLQCCNRAEWSPVENRVVRIYGAAQDITDRKNNERRIYAYARLAHELNNADTLREASRLMTDVAGELLSLDAAVLVMFDEDTGLCRSVLNTDTVNGKKTDVLSDLDDRQPTPQMRKIIEHGAELILRQDPNCVTEGFTLFGNRNRRSASLLYVPIRDGTRTVGMFSIQSYTPNAYKQAGLDTLQSLADQCAATLTCIRSRELQYESQERLALASQTANIGHWNWDMVTHHVEYSDVWLSQLGYVRAELDDHIETWKSMLHPEDKDNVIRLMMDYAEGRAHEYKTEMRMRHKNGYYRWILTQGKLLKNHDGKPKRMVGCHIDITEQKESEIEKNRLLSLLQATLESSADGLLVVNNNGKISLYNQRFTELWHIPKELLALNDDTALLNFVPTQLADPDKFLADVRKLYATPEATSFDSLLFKDGRVFERFSQPQKIDGKIVGRVWSFRDVTARNRADIQLAESESRLRTIFTNEPECIKVVDAAGRLTQMNPAGLAMIEADSLEQVAGRPILNLIAPEHRHAFAELHKRVIAGEVMKLKFEVIGLKGGRRWLETHAVPMQDNGKTVQLAVTRDITERKQAEQARQTSENNLRAVLNYAPIGIWMQNSIGRLLFINQTFCNAVGIPEERFVAVPHYSELLPPDVAASCMASDRVALAENGPSLSHERLQFTDGKMHDLEILKVRLTEKPHGINGLIGISLDITERKRAEAAARQSQQQFAELVNNIDGIVWEADAQTLAMTFVSYQAERILGYPQQAWLENKTFCPDHIHPDDRKKVVQTCLKQIELGQSYDCEYRMIAADGRIIWMRNLVVVDKENGKLTGLRGIMVDVTKSKQSELMAEESAQRLRIISRKLIDLQEAERRHLARELHDEVGQTLTATKLILESLKHQTVAANENALLTNATEHVDQLLKSIRSLSLNLRPAMLDDFGLVSALRWLLDQHAQTTDRIVEFHADYTVEHPDHAIETACFRIAQEAFTNITRYSQAEKVSVTLHTDADGIKLVISDDGVGFDVSAARQNARNGNSLGLLNMQERAALVGGNLEIISAPGKGTEVSARFPLASPATLVTFNP